MGKSLAVMLSCSFAVLQFGDKYNRIVLQFYRKEVLRFYGSAVYGKIFWNYPAGGNI